MHSLYGKLFRYREREFRSPREDYLTECLADFFNRLDVGLQTAFASNIFIPGNLKSRFEAISQDVRAFRLETQFTIRSGRIDLVLFADEKPIVAIENKIGAEIRDDQLSLYGGWIRNSAPRDAFSVVCLLTHLTEPPQGFADGGEVSGKAVPHVAKWAAIASLLRRLAESIEVGDHLRMLAHEFRLFLEEAGMTMEYAGRDEFAAALVYLRAGSRMDHTFSSIFSHVKSIDGHFRRNESSREYSLKFDTEFKLIWGWSYLAHPVLTGLFFGYGIALEPHTIFRGGAIPSTDSVFVCLGADDKRSIQAVRAAKDEPQKPWTYADISDWFTIISFKPLHSFLQEPETLASKMIDWIDGEAPDVNAFVARLK